jgi:alpha-glucosidase
MQAATTPPAAEWQSIGTVTPGTPEENQISFRSPRSLVSISVLAPDLVRVRITSGSSFGPDYSWAVIKPLADWPKATMEFATQGNGRVIRIAELEVRVRLKPFGVAFYDHEDRLISKDDDAHPVAWDGARVRNWRSMPPDGHYLGLGEKAGPLDRRHHTYVMWNTDVYGWGASTDPLYEEVPFFMGLRNGRAYGLFFDSTYRSSFDFGVETPNLYSFGAEGGEKNYYFFWGPDPKKILSRYTELVGRTPLPPLWAIGYHQCRYSYYPDKLVRFIADNFRIRHIPCDAIFLDIHYMVGFRVFTWDKSRFPDPAALTGYLHDQGFHVVTIIDPDVKQDHKGVAGNDFAKLPDGQVFIGKVCPGESAFPDFTWDRVREWWDSLLQRTAGRGGERHLE